MSPRGPVAYVSDIEGQWERFVGFAERSPLVSLEGERLVLADDATFVFGGDAVDRGPSSRRLVRTLLDASDRYGARVVLLAGNRDLNKLRLAAELEGHPPASTPTEARTSRVATLRHILARTMGAPDAFAWKAAELEHEGLESDDDAVARAFLDEVGTDGLLTRYLARTVLAHRHGETLFLHGGLGTESLGHVPGHATRLEDVDDFVARLNEFVRDRMDRFRNRSPHDLERPPWTDLVDYQAPLAGLRENPRSVVYGRLSDGDNNPSLPAREVVTKLRNAGIHRLVVGHSPSGDLPAILRGDDFELVIADNSRSRVPSGASVVLDGAVTSTRGATELDDGTRLEVSSSSAIGTRSPVGARTKSEHRLVKATLAGGGALTYRGLPGYVIEQKLLPDDDVDPDRVEAPWPRSRDAS